MRKTIEKAATPKPKVEATRVINGKSYSKINGEWYAD
jgi:hypothetical protein